jgi:hypothetical protein
MSFFQAVLVILILYFIFNEKFRMSIINDFKGLNSWEKSLAMTFVALSLFWISSFYLFKPDILQYQWYVILSIALTLSIVFYLLNVANVFFQSDIIYNNDKDFFIFSSFFQPVAELLLIIAITYFFNWSFRTMIMIALGINIYRCSLFGVIYLAKKKP